MSYARTLLLFAGLMGLPGLANAVDFKTLVQDRAEAGIEAVPDTIPYSYLVDIEYINENKPEDSFTGQYRVNPSAKSGERIMLMGANWEDSPKGIRKQLEQDNQKKTEAEFSEDFWCQGDQETFDILVSDEVTILRENAAEAVVTLGPDALAHFIGDDGEDREMPGKILKRMDSEVTFSKPDLRLTSSHIWLTRPTTVKIVAKMKEMDFNTGCSVAPNGLSYVSHYHTKVSGKAVGKSFGAIINLKLSDLQPN